MEILRYIRRKLAASGLLPQSRLAYFALLMLGMDLLLVLIRWLILLAARTSSTESSGTGTPDALRGWIGLLTFVNAILFGILAIRWLRNTLMWRLRNRLIVTYLFIGVIPVGLIAAMVLLGGYLIASQFAIFLASYDIHTEIDSLQETNAQLAGRLADAARRGVPLSQPSVLQENLAVLYKNFPGLEVTATFKGQTETFSTQSAHPGTAPPAWIKSQYGGLVSEEDHTLYLRTVTLTPVGNDILTVQACVPVNATELSRISRNLRAVGFLNKPVATAEGFQAGDAVNLKAERNIAGNVGGGSVPPATHLLDHEIQFESPFPIANWQTGVNQNRQMLVRTRLAVLYPRLFLTSSDYAERIRSALVGSAIFFALIELVALIIGLRLTRTITRSVAALYQGTERLNQVDFRHRIEVKARDQLAALETSFNSMTTSLEALIAEQKEKQRLESELAIAQEVQGQLFPKLDQQIASLEWYGVSC